MNRLEVYKFGGVAMGTPDAVRGAAERVAAAPARLAVVVSAMSGVTDLLLGAMVQARVGVRKSKDSQYGDQNTINDYKPCEEHKPAPRQNSPAQQPAWGTSDPIPF